MNAKAANLDAVGTRDVFDEWRFACNADERFTRVAILVEGTNIAGGEGGGEGEGYRVLGMPCQ